MFVQLTDDVTNQPVWVNLSLVAMIRDGIRPSAEVVGGTLRAPRQRTILKMSDGSEFYVSERSEQIVRAGG